MLTSCRNVKLDNLSMYELFVSLRYLKSRRRQGFISLITVISVGGVAVGVMVLIVVLSVMSGFETTLKERLLGVNAHLWVLPQRTGQLQGYRELASQVETIPRVTHTTPFTAHEVMLIAGGRVAGTIVRGIDPDERTQTADFARLFEGRDLKALLHPSVINADGAAGGSSQSAGRGIVLGEELATALRVNPGDQIILNSPMGILQPAGILPNIRGFTVTGTFVTGMYEYDAKLALISLDEAQELFDLGEMVHGIEVRVDDIYRVREVAEATESLLGPGVWTRDWMQMNRTLFSALRQERVLMFIILVLIILVAAFNIISTLIMMVMEKTGAIAILKAMGASNRGIYRIFMVQGLVIGLVGMVFGTIAGLILAWNLPEIATVIEGWMGIQFFPPEVYVIDRLPVEIRPFDVIAIVVTSVCVSFLATLYPAWNASRLDPVVALRYE